MRKVYCASLCWGIVYHSAAIIGKDTKSEEVNWLEKNNDTLQPEWLAKLVGSKHRLEGYVH